MRTVRDIFNATKFKRICLDCFNKKEMFEDFFNRGDVSHVLLTKEPMVCSICVVMKPVIEDIEIIGLNDPMNMKKNRPDDWIKLKPFSVESCYEMDKEYRGN